MSELEALATLPDDKLVAEVIGLRRKYDDLEASQYVRLSELTDEYIRRGKKDQAIFVYGTLADEQLQLWLWGETFKGVDAILEGYDKQTYSSGIHYVVPDTDSEVKGKVYHITERQLARADVYEGSQYKRVKAKVKIAGEYVPAMVYAQNEKYFERFDEK